MSYRISFFIFLLLFSLINNKIVYSQTFASFNEFNEYIQDIMLESVPVQKGEEINISLVQLDDQFKLPSCPSAINTSIGQPGVATPTNTVILKCHDSTPWVLYIPVQVKLMTDTLTAARRIMPGEVISDNDVLIQKNDKNQLYGDYFNDKNLVTGLIATRLIQPGVVFSKKNLKRALMIQKNQNINLILKHGLIEITMAGIAKSDGYMNDSIKVINPSSKKMVDGVVVGPNSVQIEY